MSKRYRFKRSSGPVQDPIPAHPDALYRPQHRPKPLKPPPPVPNAVAPSVLSQNAIAAAPMAMAAGGGGGVSPWLIIGPLLAVLAAMVVGAIAYNKNKKQAEGENDPGKKKTTNEKARKNNKESPEGNDPAKPVSVANVTLNNMKPQPLLEEQKRTVPMTFKAKDDSTSNKDLPLSKNIHKKPAAESVSPTRGSPPMKDVGASSSNRPDSTKSPQQVVPINVTRLGKSPNNTPMDSSLVSPSNDIRSELSPQTKLAADRNKKADNTDSKSPSGHNLPNTDHVDQSNLFPPSSRTTTSNLSTPNKPDGSQTKKPSSSAEHGVNKSPLVSNSPIKDGKTLSASNHSFQTKGHNEFQGLQSPRSTSDRNQDEKQSTSSARSKNDTSSDQNLMKTPNDLSKSGIQPTDSSRKESRSQSHIPPVTASKRKNPNEERSDESNTSLTTPQNSTNPDQTQLMMPNVPVCKGDPSSDDENYDEVYSISTNDTKNQSKPSTTKKLNSNFNKNASTFRKKRRLHVHRSLTKYFHSKDKL